MKQVIIVLCLVLMASVSYAGAAVLAWDNPTTNTDGTPLNDLSGIVVYAGTGPDDLVLSQNVGLVNTFTWNDEEFIPGSTWIFFVSAFDFGGNDSGLSEGVSLTFPLVDLAPSVPTNLRVTSP